MPAWKLGEKPGSNPTMECGPKCVDSIASVSSVSFTGSSPVVEWFVSGLNWEQAQPLSGGQRLQPDGVDQSAARDM